LEQLQDSTQPISEGASNDDIRLDQVWQIVKRRWLPAVLIFSGITAAVAAYGMNQTPIYEAEGKLRFKTRDAASALTGIDDERGELESLDSGENPISTEIGVIRTTPIIQKVIDELGLTNEDGEPLKPRQLLGNLDVSQENGTDILALAYRSPAPETAEQIVNVLMKVYLEEHLLTNRAEAAAAREFIDKQLPGAEARAQQAEAALRDFKERNNIVQLEEETRLTVSSLDQLEDQMTTLESALADTDAQFRVLRARMGKDPQSALVATALSQAPGIQSILTELQTVEAQIATEQVRFHDQHPTVMDLQTRQANLRQVLFQRIEAVLGPGTLPANVNLEMGEVEADLVADYLRLDAQLAGLIEQAEVLLEAEALDQRRAGVLPRLEQEQRELERRLDAATATYNLLLQRLQEVRVAENQNIGNIRVIQPAEALDNPVAPRKKLYLVAGAMLGGLLAAATALLLEALDQSVKTVEEAKLYFNQPVLGVIPKFSKIKGLVRQRDTDDRFIPPLIVCTEGNSIGSESYHMLRSNLEFLNSDAPPKVLVVTSSLPQEGKSTVSSNLAAAIAQAGQKVLLIDADMHHPIQHWIWDIRQQPGLSHLLVGRASFSQTVVKPLPNLTVIPAGAVPPTPAALLDSKRVSDMLRKFKEAFDFVIIDTPALSAGASASILGKRADGTLLVVRPGIATQQSASLVRTMLEQGQQRMLGLVVNGVISTYEPYGQYLSQEFFDEATTDNAEAGDDLDIEITTPGSNRQR
jgi:capsular exopolysaccharide synthesis family protein